MEKLYTIKPLFSKTLPILAAMCLCLYFSYHTYYGERSQSRMAELKVELELKKGEAEELARIKTMLEKKAALLRPATLSRDMLEEQVQYMLGFSAENDVFVVGN